MFIFHELDTHIDKYEIESNKWNKVSLYESWYELTPKMVTWLQSQQVFYLLLDERYFDFFAFSILFTAHKPFEISQLKSLIQEKISYVKNTSHVHSPNVTHRLVNIRVDGQESEFLIGKTGQLKFELQLFFLKPDAVTTFRIAQGDRFFDDRRVTIYPRSIGLIDYLTTHIKKEKFAVLYIWEDSCQLILVNHKSYQNIHYLNMGIQLLKACYIEHEIEKYFRTGKQEIQQNTFLKKLIDEGVQFFTENLCQRLSQYLPPFHDIVLISDLLRNEIFVENFQESYRKAVNGFVVPSSGIVPVSHDYLPHESNVASLYHLVSHGVKVL